MQIVADRDLPHLAAFFTEAERALLAQIAQVTESQPGGGADTYAL
jgi:hypothetical protein